MPGFTGASNSRVAWLNWFFFPEQREVTAGSLLLTGSGGGSATYGTTSNSGLRTDISQWQGSNDTTNGTDGSWETASIPGGWQSMMANLFDLGTSSSRYDNWRAKIGAVSFVGGKKTLRVGVKEENGAGSNATFAGLHVYGEKASGQTPDDIIYINHDDTPGVEYTGPEDFGDQPLATTVVRQFRVKNDSPSKTANTINIQCNDTDFSISEDGVNWVVTINIASLSAGAESSTMYVRCVTPAVGSPLGPRFARIITTVASYT